MKIKITGLPKNYIPTKKLLREFCELNKAKRLGDIEDVDDNQLQKLKKYKVKYTKI